MTNRKINIITLGCSKNVVDSEHLAAALTAGGWTIEYDRSDFSSEVVIINTCGFIGDAKQEAIDTILESAAAKEAGKIGRLFVMGCLSERYAEELRNEIGEVDSYFGVNSFKDILKRLGVEISEQNGRILSTPAHYAYLKISEGCDRKCAFCAIPLIRGRHVSVPMEQLIEEARELATKGVRELIVIAQDTTCYGIDLYGKRRLGDLLKELAQIEGIEWIRLHYTYPDGFPDDVIEILATEPKMCHYIDMPLQHASDRILAAMKRNSTRQKATALLTRLRTRIPDIAIRTTMLVGFPNETEEDVAELEDFVRKQHFERLGTFAYSEEEGTLAGDTMTDNVSDEEKERRVERIMNLQQTISAAWNESRIGKRERVIIDRSEGEYYIARSQYDSPEVDGEILIPVSEKRLQIGKFYDVTITAAEDYDLYASTI